MKARALRHRLEYIAYRASTGVLRTLPESWALKLGGGLGGLLGGMLGRRRRQAEENLRRAFPEESDDWRRRVAISSFRHLGREGTAMLRLSRLGSAEILRRTEVEGLDILRAAIERGVGAILVTGHFGNWEIGAAAMAARGIPVDAVVLPQGNLRFNEDLDRTREHLGIRIIDKGAAPTEVLQSLSEGRVVGMVGDQNARKGGIFIDFFGTPAATAKGPALLALRSGAPLILGVAIRKSDHRQAYRIVLKEVPRPRGGSIDERVLAFTQAHAQLLERYIREVPEQYLWVHRRWRTRPQVEVQG